MTEQKNPLVLAFVGDAYWTLAVREFVIDMGKVNTLHTEANKYVCAKSQSKYLDEINLTEIEASISVRARNHKNNTTPKNCTLAEYKSATAFEAVIGYNVLANNTERLQQIKEQILKC